VLKKKYLHSVAAFGARFRLYRRMEITNQQILPPRMEITMKRINTTFVLPAVLLALGILPVKGADKGCSASSLIGTFAYTGTGSITSPPEIAGPVAEVGTQTFDGMGGTTGSAMLSTNGSISPVSITGTYIVNPDCTGTFTVQVLIPGVPAFPLHVYFVLDNTLTEFQAIETDDGLVVTRLARKQFPAPGDQRQ
jgi:hypothetical protein